MIARDFAPKGYARQILKDLEMLHDAAARAAETGEVRQDLVNSIRAQIAAGTYETPGKLDAALERLKTDPVFAEKVIRQRLGYARTGEVIFRFDSGL